MITSLELRCFKCFEKFERPIHFSQINVLTGSNGRGKSSIFQAILLLAQSFRSGKNINGLRLNGKNVKLGTFEDVMNRSSDSQCFSICFSSDDVDENVVSFVFAPDDKDPRNAVLSSLKVRYANQEEKELVNFVGGTDENISNETSVPTATSAIKAINQLRNVCFISADRQGPQNYVIKEDECKNIVGIHGEYVVHAIKEKESTILSQIIGAVSFIMGGASISVKDIDKEYIKILIDSMDGTRGYKPANVGFGYSYILPIVVLPIIVDEGAKLFIENPEAHLHPGAQSRLMDYLISIAKEKKLQLFIETHSDHVINAVRIAVKNQQYDLLKDDVAFIHVDRDKQKSQPVIWQIGVDSDGNLSDYPHDFLEEWGNQMSKLI